MSETELKKSVFIRDAIHKNINISEPVISELINCREFQRLRWISQLGGAQIAFPSASHNRYTHSLGVFHIISRVMSEAQGNEWISYEDKLIVKIAGLLHDIGHGPFSHTFEKITNFDESSQDLFSHEWYTCEIINDEATEINQVLKKYNINIAKIISIIKKDTQQCEKFQIALVSSQIDCDRMDYLMRDGYFTGVDYGAIDLDWIISNLIIDSKHGILFQHKAIASIENYLIARFHMYLQVYYHWSSLSFDWKWKKLLQRIKFLDSSNEYQLKIKFDWITCILEKKAIPINIYLQINDATMIELLTKIINLEVDELLINLATDLLYTKNSKVIAIKPKSTTDEIKYPQSKVLDTVIYHNTKDPILIVFDDQQIVSFEKVTQILKHENNNHYLIYEI